MRAVHLTLALKAFGASTVVGLVLGLMGPFGNYQSAGLAERLVYWVGVLWLGLAVTTLCLWPARGLAPRRATAAVVGLSIVSSTLMAALSWLIAVSLWPEIREISPVVWWLENLLIGVGTGLGFWFALLRPPPRIVETTDIASSALIADALCLQMEDHYVRVHTEHGPKLVLMRLSDAINATRRPGVQVHRSWWVALDSVAEVRKDGRNLRLRLTNGLEAPVSRSSIAAVRAAGLLRDAP